ncbi:hypothetical protein QQ045_012652 [Rhodiola kirilowii]
MLGCITDEELFRWMRELHGEMIVGRETQRRAYEKKMQEREAEWQNERRVLIEEVRELRRHLRRKPCEEHELVGTGFQGDGEVSCNRGKDDIAERWKKLYNVIKAELDDLIQRTHNSGSQLYGRVDMVQDLKRELSEKESIIEALKATVAAMEKEESKKAREVDILRQSLRIIVNSTKMSETAGLTKTTKSLSRLRETVNNCSK